MKRQVLVEYIRNEYGVEPDCPFRDDDTSLVFRHPGNRKWFALIMTITADKLGLSGTEIMDIVNLKCDPALIGAVRDQQVVFAAYHMNKSHWVSVLLTEAAHDDLVTNLVDVSYSLTKK